MSDTINVTVEASSAAAPKLGRITPITRPRLHLGDFLVGDAPARVIAGRGGMQAVAGKPAPTPPAEVHRTDPNLPVPMLANGPDPTVTLNAIVAKYGVGCCVESAMQKAIRHARYGAGLPVPEFTGDDTLRLYAAITGYDITQTREDGSNPTDLGTEPNQAFAYWQQHGIPLPDGTVDKIAGFISLNPRVPREWETGIAEFDFVLTGYNLPRTILGQRGEWSIVDPALRGDSAPGSLGGHEVLKVSYDQSRERNDSWEERPLTTRNFTFAYCDQITAVITRDMLNRSGVTETGLNWTALLAAAEALGGG